MSTEGTALEGLLQQEREALVGENASVEDIDPAVLAAAVEARLKLKMDAEKAKPPNTDDADGPKPTETPLPKQVST